MLLLERHNMTIIVDSHPVTELPDTVTEFYQRYPFLEAEATSFLLKSVRVFDKPEGVLYVTQKEYAVVKSDDKNVSVLGTDDATTCHIAVLVNRADSSVCLAHIDSADDLDDLSRMVSDVLGSHSTTKSNTSQLELSILGGYCDERDTSEMLTLELLHFCSQSSVNFHLKSFCVGYVNMKQCGGINWPIIYGACVDIHSDFTISPAKFKSNVRGPCLSLRSSRFLSRQCNTLYRVYHSHDGIFKIEPFKYRCDPQMVHWVLQSDDFILRHFSTSPAVEPEHFSYEMKQVFQFVIQNPFPMESVFKSNQSVKFLPSPQGQWVKL